MKQIAPVVGVLTNAVVTAGTGGANHLIEIGLGLLTATATAYAANRHGKVSEKDAHIERIQKDADEGWAKAEEHALARTPPLQA